MFILQINVMHIYPRKPKLRWLNSRTNSHLGYSKRQIVNYIFVTYLLNNLVSNI